MSAVDTILAHTVDVDAHEMAPLQEWGPMFGEAAGRIAQLMVPFMKKAGANDFYNPDLQGDREDITVENVWNIRGTRAPGAFDFDRRLEVLDVMGIDKQLVFPSYALMASAFMVGNEHTLRQLFMLDISEPELRELGRRGLQEYNDWAVVATRLSPERMRIVGYLVAQTSVAQLLAQASDLIGRGVAAVNLPSGAPPAGVSPADPVLDPFWELLESTDTPLLLHVGNEFGLLASSVWGKAPAFKPGKVESHELGLEPYSFATVHYSPMHYLTVMTLGGVFERFPRLRFGAIETGASWFGPLADSLDMWARDVYSTRLKPFLSMLPSEYFARNVRVTPFNNFEPIEQAFERYPHLQDCYCYSTDYPHIEGGKNIKSVFHQKLAHLGTDTLDKFFRTNAELLIP